MKTLKDGRAGMDGIDGLDGHSAFEIAQRGGYLGSESEWIASLKGKDGRDGKDGVSGLDGKDGQDGQNGQTGSAGLDGNDGSQGDIGPTGKNGRDGNPGAAGLDGWSPLEAVANDGERCVIKVVGWVGGEGSPPQSGFYLGPNGPVETVEQATDIRGRQGNDSGAYGGHVVAGGGGGGDGRLHTEVLVVTGINEITDISVTPASTSNMKISVNGASLYSPSHFSVTGRSFSFSAVQLALIGYSIATTDFCVAEYFA